MKYFQTFPNNSTDKCHLRTKHKVSKYKKLQTAVNAKNTNKLL